MTEFARRTVWLSGSGELEFSHHGSFVLDWRLSHEEAKAGNSSVSGQLDVVRSLKRNYSCTVKGFDSKPICRRPERHSLRDKL